MTRFEIQQKRAELERLLKKTQPGSGEEDSIRAQLRELDTLQSEAEEKAAPAPTGGDSFNSGGGAMNIATGQGTAIQHNYYGSTQQQPGASGEKAVLEEIELLVAQNNVQAAIERLLAVPEHRQEAIGLSRRWHAIQGKKRQQLLTDEQAETEVNKIVGALLEICAPTSSSQNPETSSQPTTSGRDYFENVGGNVYTGPVTIHHGPKSDR